MRCLTVLPVRTAQTTCVQHQYISLRRIVGQFRDNTKYERLRWKTKLFHFVFFSRSSSSSMLHLVRSFVRFERNSWKWKCAPRPRILLFHLFIYLFFFLNHLNWRREKKNKFIYTMAATAAAMTAAMATVRLYHDHDILVLLTPSFVRLCPWMRLKLNAIYALVVDDANDDDDDAAILSKNKSILLGLVNECVCVLCLCRCRLQFTSLARREMCCTRRMSVDIEFYY